MLVAHLGASRIGAFVLGFDGDVVPSLRQEGNTQPDCQDAHAPVHAQ